MSTQTNLIFFITHSGIGQQAQIITYPTSGTNHSCRPVFTVQLEKNTRQTAQMNRLSICAVSFCRILLTCYPPYPESFVNAADNYALDRL